MPRVQRVQQTPDSWTGYVTVENGPPAAVIGRAYALAGGSHNMTGIRVTATNDASGQQYQQQSESDSEIVYVEIDLPEGRYSVKAVSWSKIATAVSCKIYAG
jgi:hypothetical protein